VDFSFTKDEECFRNEVIDFINEYPTNKFKVELQNNGLGWGAGSSEYTRLLGKKGWISMTWPKEYGGQNRDLKYRYILMEELAYHRAPQAFNAFNYSVGGSIILHGTEKQKKTFLPKIGSGEIIFCTALSEPDAGSDLFGTETLAERKENEFVLNGKKIWTTQAHLSDWVLLLARTRGEKSSKSVGLSTFLVDLKSPGITISPIPNIAKDEEFCEIFLDDVHVPAENILGEENQGLPVVFESLEEDRFWLRAVRPAASKRDLEDLVKYTRETKSDGKRLADNPRIRCTLIELACEIEACRLLTYKVLWKLGQEMKLTHEASMIKVLADHIGQNIADLGLDCIGGKGWVRQGDDLSALGGYLAQMYCYSPGYTIGGGTTEIQKLTIASRGLKLPKL